MNVDTGEFAALSRKVSTLTGRVTVMGNRMNRLDEQVGDDVHVLVRLVASLMEYSGLIPRERGTRTAPKRERHLHVVK